MWELTFCQRCRSTTELQTSSEYDQVQVDPRDEPGSSKLVDVQEVSRAD